MAKFVIVISEKGLKKLKEAFEFDYKLSKTKWREQVIKECFFVEMGRYGPEIDLRDEVKVKRVIK